MRRASVDEDCVASTRVKLRAACMYNFDPVEIGKIPARALSQILVNLNANHVAARAYDFRHDRRVIAYAAPYVKNSIACLKLDRKSTRLNSSHANISYAVFCLKKKKTRHWTRSTRGRRRCSAYHSRIT